MSHAQTIDLMLFALLIERVVPTKSEIYNLLRTTCCDTQTHCILRMAAPLLCVLLCNTHKIQLYYD